LLRAFEEVIQASVTADRKALEADWIERQRLRFYGTNGLQLPQMTGGTTTAQALSTIE